MRILRLVPLLAAVPCWAGALVLTNLDTGLFTQSVAYGINSSNQILINGAGTNYVLQGTSLRTLTMFPSSVMDIDDAGNVMGRFGGLSVVVSSSGATLLSLGSNYRGLGLSNSGLIAGVTRDGFVSFIYDSGAYENLTHRTGGASDTISANDINNSRTAVGEWHGMDMISHAFAWSGGSFTELTIPGAFYSSRGGLPAGAVALGINDAGQIVGLAYDSAGHQFGWIYSGGSYTTVLYSGAVDTAVFQINGNGDVVGNYRGTDGVQHGFLGVAGLSTPEPASVCLVGAALALLGFSRGLRRRARCKHA